MFINFTPDEDGVIDLTTADEDMVIDLTVAEFDTPESPQTISPCPNYSTDYQRSAVITEPFPAKMKPQRPIYNYADHIPRPTVVYIKDEEQADEMVASLNGQVMFSSLSPMLWFHEQ